MKLLGYAWLHETLRLPTLPPVPRAIIGATTKILLAGDMLLVPAAVAPKNDCALEHVLFALKHEGCNLGLLSCALKQLPAADLEEELRQRPNSRFARVAACLWEHYNQTALADPAKISGPYVDVFDKKIYFEDPQGTRYPRWRVRFNGIGSIDYCVSIRRTAQIEQLQQCDILSGLERFVAQVGAVMLDRALAWAYLSETESSFEIERETPCTDKAERFVQLLHHAHDGRALSEDYLVELQQSIVSNPLDQAVSYRTEQNWLRNQMRGPVGVSYVPPSPDDIDDLMQAFNHLCNHPPAGLDPLMLASIASFGFVYIHPFMDGNGRLSRFLFHHALCRSGRMTKGFLLPVSIAIKRNEGEYLAVLQAFSQPARRLWQVRTTGDSELEFSTGASADLYRYWDATAAVAFGLRMAKEALEHDLQQETRFLAGYDRVLRMVNDRYDVRSTLLPTLINACYEQNGRVSLNLRKKFGHLVQEQAFNWIESCVSEVFFDAGSAND